MDDQEIRQALITICEMLKTEFHYLAAIQHGISSLFRATKEELPHLEARYTEQWGHFATYPGSAQLLQQVQELLEQLKKN
jgi:hypothetical protein